MFATWRPESFSIGGRQVQVSLIPIGRANPSVLSRWEDLATRAAEDNVYLSPHFLLPAVRHLTPRQRVLLLMIRRLDDEAEPLIGLGAFIARPPVARFPLPHLQAYRSPHTFLTGMLIDSDHHWLALEALGMYLCAGRVQWCGIEFEERLADGVLDQIYADPSVTSRVGYSEYERCRRAILVPETARDMAALVMADGKLGKELKRKRRRLDERGDVSWHFRLGKEVTPEVIETFLHLENQGWKAERGKSMMTRPGHAEFFREMSTRFALAGQAFFTELALDGRVIASTSNFIAGRTAFAFKIGWDAEFASVSPSLINELQLMEHAGRCLPNIDLIDSGADEGSFIEQLWRDHRKVSMGVLTGGLAGAAILPALNAARRFMAGRS